jgi:hypothetical protein
MSMPKISKEELKKRKAELGLRAREEIAKTEVMRFRLDPKNILILCELAEKRHQHVGAMVREWVLERMETETAYAGKSTAPPGKVSSKKVSENETNSIDILQRLDRLEKELTRLKKQTAI